MRKTIVWVAIVAILLICIHYLFLSRKAPKETYPDDTFLDTLKEKRAVIIVAHDDDAIGVAGTVSQLCTSGWNVKELCFYNTDTDAAKIARIQQRQEDVSTVKQIEGLADFVYFNIPFRKVTNLSGPEYMPLTKEEFDKQYDTDTLRYYIRRFIDDNKPAVIFSMDNNIGGCGHPDHVIVSKLVLDECSRRYRDSTFPVHYIYQFVYSPSMADHILGDLPVYKAALSVYGKTMPLPDVQVNIASAAVQKKSVMKAYTTEQNCIRKMWPYYNYYPAFVYFDLFNREFFKIIKLK